MAIRSHYSLLKFCLLCSAMLAFCPVVFAGETKISGFTYRWQDAATGEPYSALPGVKITVVRDGAVVITGQSKDDGSYSVSFPSERPITVIFYLSRDDVPEMQSLSSKSGDEHQLSIALMTVAQHQELERKYQNVLTVRDKVHCVLVSVPKTSGVAEIVSQVTEKQ
jgi:hypothetical protein